MAASAASSDVVPLSSHRPNPIIGQVLLFVRCKLQASFDTACMVFMQSPLEGSPMPDSDRNLLERYIPDRKKIPEAALALMLLGILFPTAFYAFHLAQGSPTPADLLVAVSISLFASVLFLWIMDATDILPFKAAWISKSVYSAAIVSILGTSVAVYKDYFNAHKYPYEGPWQVVLTNSTDSTHPIEFSTILTYSENGGRYWGYSNLISMAQEPATIVWAEVTDFVPEEKTIQLRVHLRDGTQRLYDWPLDVSRKGRFLKSKQPSSGFTVELRRPA
jgi:hypothetical protein